MWPRKKETVPPSIKYRINFTSQFGFCPDLTYPQLFSSSDVNFMEHLYPLRKIFFKYRFWHSSLPQRAVFIEMQSITNNRDKNKTHSLWI